MVANPETKTKKRLHLTVNRIQLKGTMIKASLPKIDELQARGRAQEAFHAQAEGVARERFGNEVFVRGVVEVSNYCRENCHYCGMRRDNRDLTRYRAQVDQLAELLVHHCPSSVRELDIQAGEDPVVVRRVVLPLIRILREETSLGITLCLGSLSWDLYRQLREAGAETYILKFEIGDPELYAEMESPGTHRERIEHIEHLASEGWNVSSGFIVGLPGENERKMMANFELAQELPLAGCSVSPFVPGETTPLARAPMGNIDLTLNSMAALRVMRPDWLIPCVSALNIVEPDGGYERGLRAGANLVTINLTPSEVRGEYLLYKRDRFLMTEETILKSLGRAGLKPAEQSVAEALSGSWSGSC